MIGAPPPFHNPPPAPSGVSLKIADSVQRGFVICQQPAMIAMSEANIDLIGDGIQRECISLVALVLQRNPPIVIVPAHTRDRAMHSHRPSELFRARSDIQSMQEERPATGDGHHVHRAGGDVDDRGTGNAEQGRNAFHIVARNRNSQADPPQKRTLLVCIKRVHCIVLRRHENHVVVRSVDANLRHVQWLRVDLSVDLVGA